MGIVLACSCLALQPRYFKNLVQTERPKFSTRNPEPLPVIDYETFFDPSNETARSYATGYKPYMLINGMNHWDLDVLGNKEVLTEHFKSSRVDYYPHNMREEDVRPYFSELGSAIDNFENPTGLFDRIDASERTAYIQWNMKDAEWDKMKELGEPV